MPLERARTYRLVRKGDPGLTFDADGVSLGGVALVSASVDAETRTGWRVRAAEEVGAILELACGRQGREVMIGPTQFETRRVRSATSRSP